MTAAPPHGFSSETLAFEAVAARDGDDTYHVYYLGDCDRAGHDAARALEEKLTRFAHEEDIEVIFEQIAVTKEQVKQWGLPTREPNRKSAADKKWPYGPCLDVTLEPSICDFLKCLRSLDTLPPFHTIDYVSRLRSRRHGNI